jgi:hypothetical protein
VTPSARASSSTRTASGPPAASARSPSSIQLLRGVRVGADIAYQYRFPQELTARQIMANLHPYITVWMISTMRLPNTTHTSRLWLQRGFLHGIARIAEGSA